MPLALCSRAHPSSLLMLHQLISSAESARRKDIESRRSKPTVDLADEDELVLALRVSPAPGCRAAKVLAGVGHCAKLWQVDVVWLGQLARASFHGSPVLVAGATWRRDGPVQPVKHWPAGVVGDQAQPVGLVEACRRAGQSRCHQAVLMTWCISVCWRGTETPAGACQRSRGLPQASRRARCHTPAHCSPLMAEPSAAPVPPLAWHAWHFPLHGSSPVRPHLAAGSRC